MATRPDDAGAPAPAATPPVSDGAPSFADAFAAAAAEDTPGEIAEPIAPAAETPPAAEPPAGETPPAGEPPAGEPPAGEPPAGEPPAGSEPPAGTPPVASPDGAAPPAAPAAPAAPTAPAQPQNLADEIARGVAEALKQNAPAAPGTQEQEPAPAVYTPEEQQLLTEYEKNWPDVAQAETIKRRAEYHDLLKYAFTEVHKFYAPIVQQVQAMGNSLHTQELTTAVPDYTPALEEDVTKWIDTQPAYLQTPMKQVMQTGTSEEVADLIGRYRAASGAAPASTAPAAPAAPAPAGKAPAAPAQSELSPLAKQAAESLAPVSSDRTQVPAGEDTGNFETAFARYAAEEAQSPT